MKSATDYAERIVADIVGSRPGLRKAQPAHSSVYASWSRDELKAESIRLFVALGLSKRATVRAFGVPWETGREWIDARFPKFPPADFVEWLSLQVAASSLVRRAS